MKFVKTMIILTIFLTISYSSYSATLYWFCAAAVKKPSEEIVKLFNKTHKDKVLFIAGGTGQVLQQMILSKRGDIYTCLDSNFFNQAKQKHLIVKYTKFLRLIPVFGLSKTGEARIHSFNDLFKPGIKIAGGNPKTMALGKTYKLIMDRLDKTRAKRLKMNTKVYAINISQIVNYLKMSVVDAGIVFKSVAYINHFKYVTIPKNINQVKTGYLIEMKYSKNKKAQLELYKFILGHLNIYKKYGFTVMPTY